jgi:hypothetical protein
MIQGVTYPAEYESDIIYSQTLTLNGGVATPKQNELWSFKRCSKCELTPLITNILFLSILNEALSCNLFVKSYKKN